MRYSTIASVLACAASVSAHWNSSSVAPGTVTEDVTVTDYTTYCPYSTVVTVTKCSEDKCAPSAITVTEATTLTVTGECIVPTTHAPAPAPESSSNSTGSTVVSHLTVTDYTTYCPASTVVTVTTCAENTCAPHVVTVSEATTLTVTGECVVPTTVAPSPETPAQTTPAVTSAAGTTKAETPKSTVAAESTFSSVRSAAPSSASVSEVENGANSLNAFGVAGLVGAAALLL